MTIHDLIAIKFLADEHRGYLREDEFQAILAEAGKTRNPERDQLIVWLVFSLGLTYIQVAKLKLEDFYDVQLAPVLEHDLVEPKTGTISYSPEMALLLNVYIQKRLAKLRRVHSVDHVRLKPSAPLIVSENGKAYALKIKKQRKVDGGLILSEACDTLQACVGRWQKAAGIEVTRKSRSYICAAVQPEINSPVHSSVKNRRVQ